MLRFYAEHFIELAELLKSAENIFLDMEDEEGFPDRVMLKSILQNALPKIVAIGLRQSAKKAEFMIQRCAPDSHYSRQDHAAAF